MAKLEAQFRDELSAEDIDCLLGIAQRQAAIRVELKAALECGDEAAALVAARKLVGAEREVTKQ